jgi:cation diffusion facilitator family transporter
MKESGDVRGLQLTLTVYIVIFAMKLVAYFLSGVMALLAESLHTLSDIFIAGFLLFATYYSRKRADQVHMFGYGRAQNVAALVAATLFISFTSYKLYEEAFPRLFRPGEATYQNLGLALGVIVVSMLFAAAPLVALFRQSSAARPPKPNWPSWATTSWACWRPCSARCSSSGASRSPTRSPPSS